MAERVVIADDHPLFRDALRRIVQRVITGQIVEVADTTSLVEELQCPPTPSAMFLDLVFPGFEGAKTVKKLRQDFQRWSRNFEPVVKVDHKMREVIQEEETKEPFARVQSPRCA